MRIFIGHMAPEGEELGLNLSVAANHFSNNLLKGGMFDRAYSILPTFVRGKKNRKQLNSSSITTIYSSLRRLPGRLSILAPLWEQTVLFFRIPRHSHVWLYNVTSLNFFLVKMLEWFKPSVRIYPIVLDFTPGQPHDQRILNLINRCTGRISLTNYEGISKRNFACLPGVVPPSNGNDAPRKEVLKPSFLLSGQLSDNIAMLSTVIRVFRFLPEAELHITGKLPDPEGTYALMDGAPNIHYHGMVSTEEYLDLLHNRVTFQLSTRNPAFPENQCNFPSKIIEALLHNLAVVSTIEYPQIDGIGYFHIGSDENSMQSGLKQIVSLPHEELSRYVNQADQVRQRFSTQVWQQTINQIEQAE